MKAKVLKNFSLFVDGRGYVGKAEEVTPPKLSIKTEEFRGGGMDIPTSIDLGMEKLECQFNLVEYDPEVMKLFGLVNSEDVAVTLRGALNDDTTTSSLVITLRGKFKELDMGKFKAGDKSTLGCSVNCNYYKLTIDGTDLIEIDVDNMVRKINGNDVLADIRSALGL